MPVSVCIFVTMFQVIVTWYITFHSRTGSVLCEWMTYHQNVCSLYLLFAYSLSKDIKMTMDSRVRWWARSGPALQVTWWTNEKTAWAAHAARWQEDNWMIVAHTSNKQEFLVCLFLKLQRPRKLSLGESSQSQIHIKK